MRRNLESQELQKKILETLFRYKRLDLPSLHHACAATMTHQGFRRHLSILREQKLIRVDGKRGKTSMISPTGTGARVIGKELAGSAYRPLSRVSLLHRQAKVEFERIALELGYEIYPEVPVSRGDRQRLKTQPNYLALVEDYRFLETSAIEELPANQESEKQRRRDDLRVGIYPVIPDQFRDYYIRQPGLTGFVVILGSPYQDKRYWLRKIEQYTKLLEYFTVVVIYHEEPPALIREALKQAGIYQSSLNGAGKLLRGLLQ